MLFHTLGSAICFIMALVGLVLLIVLPGAIWQSQARFLLGGLLLAGLPLIALLWQRSSRLSARTITQLEQQVHRSETRFRLMASQLSDVVFVCEHQWQLTYVAPTVQALLGFTPAELLGRSLPTLFVDADIPAFLTNNQLSADTHSLAQLSNLRMRHKDGAMLNVQLRLTSNEDLDNQAVCGLIRIIVNGPALLAAPPHMECGDLLEQASQQRMDETPVDTEMTRVIQAKDAFLSTMSHELRTPLSAILGLAESLSDEIYGPLTAPQRQVLATIQQSGGHLLTLINDILDMAKIDAGKLVLQIDRFLVSEVCQSSLRMVYEAALKKGVLISFQLDNPHLTLYADPRRLKQILFKLLSNAVKFTPDGGHISLTVTADPEQAAIRFAVQDTGIGISAVAINQLFTPFTQLDSRLSRQYEGSGIGLALVRQMVDLHGGSVQVESQGVPGQGSRFTVSLPWQGSGIQASSLSASEASLPHGYMPRCCSERPQATILLVEDNVSSSTAISEYLNFQGYAVHVAYNGRDGLQCAREQQPDLILMDIQMPILDGLEVTQQLRADVAFAHTPIIALTALAMPGDRERCMEAGVNVYLTKPVSLRVLLATIQQHLRYQDGVARAIPHD